MKGLNVDQPLEQKHLKYIIPKVNHKCILSNWPKEAPKTNSDLQLSTCTAKDPLKYVTKKEGMDFFEFLKTQTLLCMDLTS